MNPDIEILRVRTDKTKAMERIARITTALSPARQYTAAAAKMSVTRPRVYITRNVPQGGVNLLQQKCLVTQWQSDEPIPRGELLKNVRGKRALFCLLTERIDAELLDAAGPELKVVATMSVGFDHIDLKECKRRNIPVGYTPGVLTDAVAELTVALLLATCRRLVEAVNEVRNGGWGTWKPMWLLGTGLNGKTIGIVGLGRIGFAVGKILRAFGISQLLYYDEITNPAAGQIQAEAVPFDDLVQRSDVVIAMCALTPATTGMFNRNVFAKMKSSAIFINTSRGGVVNQDDLHRALVNNDIRAAGLDVTVPEPLVPTHPLVRLPNCVVLPHIASATEESRGAMSELTARNILAFLEEEEMPARIV